jgi:microtubule-associated protein 1 light chain
LKPSSEPASHKPKFKEKNSENRRKRAADAIRNAGQIPVIVEKASDSSVPALSDCKFLVPPSSDVEFFIQFIKNELKEEFRQLNYTEPLLLFSNGRQLPDNELISDIYESAKDEDGFLYLVYV